MDEYEEIYTEFCNKCGKAIHREDEAHYEHGALICDECYRAHEYDYLSDISDDSLLEDLRGEYRC